MLKLKRLTLIDPPRCSSSCFSSLSSSPLGEGRERWTRPPRFLLVLLLIIVQISGQWGQSERRTVRPGRRRGSGPEASLCPRVRGQAEGGRPRWGAVRGAVVSLRVVTGTANRDTYNNTLTFRSLISDLVLFNCNCFLTSLHLDYLSICSFVLSTNMFRVCVAVNVSTLSYCGHLVVK